MNNFKVMMNGCFIHPVTGEEMRFETRIPEKFTSTAK